jgi:hypothetical protein
MCCHRCEEFTDRSAHSWSTFTLPASPRALRLGVTAWRIDSGQAADPDGTASLSITAMERGEPRNAVVVILVSSSRLLLGIMK